MEREPLVDQPPVISDRRAVAGEHVVELHRLRVCAGSTRYSRSACDADSSGSSVGMISAPGRDLREEVVADERDAASSSTKSVSVALWPGR